MVGRRMAQRLAGATPWLPTLGQAFSPARRKNRAGKGAPKVTEYSLHRTVADLLDWLLLPPTVWTTIPSGWGKLPPATAGMLRACGLKPGMPDLMVFHPGLVFGIELKVKGNYQSAAQLDMQARLSAVGIAVFVARSVDEVITILQQQGIPIRNTA
jgi:hypothetical protein